MKYYILISRQAEKEIEKIPRPFAGKIKDVILALATNPRPHGYKKLQGRIVYDINDKIVTVYILDVMNRKDVYRK